MRFEIYRPREFGRTRISWSHNILYPAAISQRHTVRSLITQTHSRGILSIYCYSEYDNNSHEEIAHKNWELSSEFILKNRQVPAPYTVNCIVYRHWKGVEILTVYTIDISNLRI